MSELIQPSGDDETNMNRRSLLKNMGIGALGAILGTGASSSPAVSAEESSTPQISNCGTAMGTVVDPGGKEGLEHAAFNVLVPREPQATLVGQLMTPNGSVATEVEVSDESLASIQEEGIPDVENQLSQGGGFKLGMESGQKIIADRLFRSPNGGVQLTGVRFSFADHVLNVAGFPPPSAPMNGEFEGGGDTGQSVGNLSNAQRRAVRRWGHVQGWEVAIIFGVVVIISSLLCIGTAWNAAEVCEKKAVVNIDWNWYGTYDCSFKCIND